MDLKSAVKRLERNQIVERTGVLIVEEVTPDGCLNARGEGKNWKLKPEELENWKGAIIFDDVAAGPEQD